MNMATSQQRWGDRQAQSGFSDTDNVLMQIALSFTIILGYLLSEGLATQVSLTGRLKNNERTLSQREKELGQHRKALDGLKDTPAGRLARQKAETEEELQKLKLLNAWNEVKPERVLRQRLDALSKVDVIQLSGEQNYFPSDARYQELLREAARVFPASVLPDTISREEVSKLLVQTWNRVRGFDRRGQEQAAKQATQEAFALLPPAKPDLAELLSFDFNVPMKMNLRFVAGVIRQDLEGERKQLAPLQLRLVERIALARLNSQPVGIAQTDPRQILRALVSELKEPLGLLPEVEEQLLRNP